MFNASRFKLKCGPDFPPTKSAPRSSFPSLARPHHPATHQEPFQPPTYPPAQKNDCRYRCRSTRRFRRRKKKKKPGTLPASHPNQKNHYRYRRQLTRQFRRRTKPTKKGNPQVYPLLPSKSTKTATGQRAVPPRPVLDWGLKPD